MKQKLTKFSIAFLGCFIFIKTSFAQSPCGLNGTGGQAISTAPATTAPTYKTNTFDWTTQLFSVVSIPPPSIYSTTTQLTSPFYLGYYTYLEDIGFGAGSDFRNSSGWELI